MTGFVTRFAPSPSGRLHLGHAFSALLAHKAAREAGGQFLLRMEDIDRSRCKAVHARAIADDLRWLGLDWDGPVRRQSAHMEDYAAALQRLRAMGVLYRCFKTRREVLAECVRAPHGPGPVYHGPRHPLSADEEAALLAAGKPFAWRLSLRAARDVLGPRWDQLGFTELGEGPHGERGGIRARPECLGDVVLARKDIATSYHLSVTHDDAAQGITHVFRGRDLFESTFMHVLLQALMGWPTPLYHHHRLICDDRGQRLATRNDAVSLAAMRAAGVSAAAVRERLGF